MTHIYLLLVIAFNILVSFEINAQKASITGTIVDKEQQLPVEFATISLHLSKDTTLITGVVTDSAGRFSIPVETAGNYFLTIRFLGYTPHTTGVFSLSKSSSYALGKIELSADQKMLNEITVTGNKTANYHLIDKQVYKASQFQSSQGGTALDVLKNTPSISVNTEGDISMRGSSGLLVLLNGKPVQSDYKALLNQLPANTIENVEVVTAPSAKFDPDGKAGIVNIVTKKGSANGFTVTANGLLGLPSTHTYHNLHAPVRFGGDATISFKKDKFEITISGNYLRNDLSGRRAGDVNTTIQQVYTSFPSDGERSFKRINYTGRASVSYSPNKNNTISAGIYKGSRFQARRADILYQNRKIIIGSNEEIGRLTYFNSNVVEKTNDITLGNLDYTHVFPKKSSMTLSGLYEHANLYGETRNLNQGYPDKSTLLQYTLNPSRNPLDAWRLKGDYGLPLDSGKLEIGYQYRYQLQKGQFQYLDQDLSNGNYILNPEFSSTTRLNNTIHSVYLQYAGKRQRWEYTAGLRYEYAVRTFIAGTAAPKDLKLSNLFPSAIVQYNINSSIRAKAGYSKRVQRTTSNELNPYPEREHSETLERGDPNILPEFIDLIELGIIKDLKGGNVFATLYHQNIQNIVNRVNSVYNDTILNRIFTNAGNARLWGLEAGTTLKITKSWQFYLGGNLYSYSIKGTLFNNEVKVNTSNLVYSFNANTSIKLSKTWTLQGNVNYISEKVTAQGKDSRLLLPNASLKKTFLDGKLSATLQWQNIDLGMLKSNQQRISTWGPEFYTTTNYIQETDIFLLNLNLNLNQLAKKSKLPASEFGEKEF